MVRGNNLSLCCSQPHISTKAYERIRGEALLRLHCRSAQSGLICIQSGDMGFTKLVAARLKTEAEILSKPQSMGVARKNPFPFDPFPFEPIPETPFPLDPSRVRPFPKRPSRLGASCFSPFPKRPSRYNPLPKRPSHLNPHRCNPFEFLKICVTVFETVPQNVLTSNGSCTKNLYAPNFPESTDISGR